MNSQTQPRRIAMLDIETVPLDPADPKGALDAMTGRIVCIGLLFDDGDRLTPNPICDVDETRLLERFWATIRDTDLLVGHNILGFDLMFIRQRSWILGVKPPMTLNLKKYYTDQVIDLMEMWTNWSSRFKGCGLDNIAGALGVGGKTGHGTDVAGWWAARDYNSIVKYCMDDVYLSYHVYCRMHYRQPIGATSVPAPALKIETPQRELIPVAPARPAAPRPTPRVRRDFIEVPAASTTPNVADPQPVRVEGFAAAANENGAAPAHYENSTASVARQAPGPAEPSRAQYRSGVKGRKRPDRICYAQAGSSLILTGATFAVKDQLGTIGGRRSKNGEGWVWHVSIGQFDALAGLCARNSIRLVAASESVAA